VNASDKAMPLIKQPVSKLYRKHRLQHIICCANNSEHQFYFA